MLFSPTFSLSAALRSTLPCSLSRACSQLQPPIPDDKFLVTVRARVEAKLKEVGWGRHFYQSIALFEVSLTVFLYLLFSVLLAQSGSYWWCIPIGLLTGRLGFFMHMGNHRAMSTNSTVNEIIEKVRKQSSTSCDHSAFELHNSDLSVFNCVFVVTTATWNLNSEFVRPFIIWQIRLPVLHLTCCFF